MSRIHPIVMPGQRVGLLGGSFDPPHQGHVHITRRALASLRLDAVWWVVSPGNPLKARGPAEFDRRVAACKALLRHPRVHVTGIERDLNSPYTANTLAALRDRCPGVRFVWLMGADNLAGFHHWQDWRWIIETVPVAVFARPGEQLHAGLSPAARLYADRRWRPFAAHGLGVGGRTGWVLLPGPMKPHSSTRIRHGGHWP